MTLEQLAAIAAKVPKPAEAASLVARKASAPEEATLYLYDVIGPSFLGGISSQMVVDALSAVKGAKTLNVRINSPGGSIFDAKAIYTTIRNFQGQKVAYVDGLAGSAASFIAMAADKIVTAPEATWFIHNAQGPEMGDAKAHREIADVLDMLTDDIRAIYAKRTGQSAENLTEWMDAETMMNAATAKERGFTDEIAEDPARRASASATDLPAIMAMAARPESVRDIVRRRTLDRIQKDHDAASRDGGRASPGATQATK